MVTRRASPADIQNRACQLKASATQADSGSPMAPPTPRVALIEAMAVEVIFGGVTSRIRLIPTGMKPIARPCRARPASIGSRVSDMAQVAEPTSRITELTSSTRCLPNMSPRRPAIGIATAAASRVAVITQDELAAEVCSRQRQLTLDRDHQGLHQRGGQATEAEDHHGDQGLARCGDHRGLGAGSGSAGGGGRLGGHGFLRSARGGRGAARRRNACHSQQSWERLSQHC